MTDLGYRPGYKCKQNYETIRGTFFCNCQIITVKFKFKFFIVFITVFVVIYDQNKFLSNAIIFKFVLTENINPESAMLSVTSKF